MEFNEHQIMLKTTVSRFAKEQVGPLAAETDLQERFPYETFDQKKDLGLLAWAFQKLMVARVGGWGAT